MATKDSSIVVDHLKMTFDGELHHSLFRSYFHNSRRRTTKPQDFILATMPQIDFYKIPPTGGDMTFSELFLDCLRQMKRRGFPVRLLFTGEVKTRLCELLNDPIPERLSIPEPTTLGDVVRLLSGPSITYRETVLAESSLTIEDSGGPTEDTVTFRESLPMLNVAVECKGYKIEVSRNFIPEPASDIVDLLFEIIPSSSNTWAFSSGDLYNFELQWKPRETRSNILTGSERAAVGWRGAAVFLNLLLHGVVNEHPETHEKFIEILTNNPSFRTRDKEMLLSAALISCRLSTGI